jgi:hypothetical protein
MKDIAKQPSPARSDPKRTDARAGHESRSDEPRARVPSYKIERVLPWNYKDLASTDASRAP